MNRDVQINIKAEVKKFFDSVYAYVDKVSAAYVDVDMVQQHARARAEIAKIQAELEQVYNADNNKYRLCCSVYGIKAFDAFQRPQDLVKSEQNPVWYIFDRIIPTIYDYYRNRRENDKERLLKLLKKWNRKIVGGKIKPQLDINIAINRFFDSVEAYTDKIYVLYTDEKDIQQLDKEKSAIRAKRQELQELAKIKADSDNAREYARLHRYRNNFLCKIFKKPNSVYSLAGVFNIVVNSIIDFYLGGARNPDKVLQEIKRWNYAISTNVFKDTIYPFIPLKYFAKQK